MSGPVISSSSSEVPREQDLHINTDSSHTLNREEHINSTIINDAPNPTKPNEIPTSRISVTRIPYMPSSCGQNTNPYGNLHIFCSTFRTKEHAQLVGVLSFSLFICSGIFSAFLFKSLSIFYISFGFIIYFFLMRSLFNTPEKVYVLFYLIFESIQLGFYSAIVLYFSFPLFFGISFDCEENKKNYKNGGYNVVEIQDYYQTKDCQQTLEKFRYQLFELLICVILLMCIKLYFTKVFSVYYKYLVWSSKGSSALRAQYINGSNIHINMEDIFPPSGLWNSPVVRDISYGYTINERDLLALPSYNEAMSTQKETNNVQTSPPTMENSPNESTQTPPENNIPTKII